VAARIAVDARRSTRREIRYEVRERVVLIMGAMLDRDRYALALHRQRLAAVLDRYQRGLKKPFKPHPRP
jgi:hypothetical protein